MSGGTATFSTVIVIIIEIACHPATKQSSHIFPYCIDCVGGTTALFYYVYHPGICCRLASYTESNPGKRTGTHIRMEIKA